MHQEDDTDESSLDGFFNPEVSPEVHEGSGLANSDDLFPEGSGDLRTVVTEANEASGEVDTTPSPPEKTLDTDETAPSLDGRDLVNGSITVNLGNSSE